MYRCIYIYIYIHMYVYGIFPVLGHNPLTTCQVLILPLGSLRSLCDRASKATCQSDSGDANGSCQWLADKFPYGYHNPQ